MTDSNDTKINFNTCTKVQHIEHCAKLKTIKTIGSKVYSAVSSGRRYYWITSPVLFWRYTVCISGQAQSDSRYTLIFLYAPPILITIHPSLHSVSVIIQNEMPITIVALYTRPPGPVNTRILLWLPYNQWRNVGFNQAYALKMYSYKAAVDCHNYCCNEMYCVFNVVK